MALLCLVDALEHPVVMEMTGGLVVPVEEEIGVGRRPRGRGV
jgi:hypothetical protein